MTTGTNPFLDAVPASIRRCCMGAVPIHVELGGTVVDLSLHDGGAVGSLGDVHVRVVLRRTRDGVKWMTSVENRGDSVVGGLSVRPLDLRLDLPPDAPTPRVRHLSGSWHFDAVYPPRAFRISEEAFVTHDHARRVKIGGSNAGIHSPLMQFGLGAPLQSAFAVGMEWSGGWRIEAGWERLSFHGEARPPFHLFATADLDHDEFQPGETLSLPSVHMIGSSGATWDDLSNHQRRHMRDMRPASGSPVFPVSYDSWFGRYEDFTIDTLLADAECAARLGVEVFCLDACWYKSTHVHSGLGNWLTPDPVRFPGGVADIRRLAEHVRTLGMKFGLWHLIQLAAPETDVVRARPELYRPAPTTPSRERSLREFGELVEPGLTAFDGLQLALEDPAGVNYALEILDHWILDWGVEWLRYESVPVDGAAYNEGYNRLLDKLRARHPHVYIEACNGGGQRLDLNSVRRTHGNWLSDHTSAAEVTRFNQAGALRFWPAHMLNMAVTAERGSGGRTANVHAVLSRMLGVLSFNGAISEWSESAVETVRAAVAKYKQYRHLLDGDVYFPLHQPQSVEDWDAVVFRDAASGESLLFTFNVEGGTRQFVPYARPEQAPPLRLVLSSSNSARAESAAGGWNVELAADSAALWHFVDCLVPYAPDVNGPTSG